MRDRLTHHYFEVELDVLWATITVRAPLFEVLAGEPPQPVADR